MEQEAVRSSLMMFANSMTSSNFLPFHVLDTFTLFCRVVNSSHPLHPLSLTETLLGLNHHSHLKHQKQID